MTVVILFFVSVCVALSLVFLLHFSVSVVSLFSSFGWCASHAFGLWLRFVFSQSIFAFEQRYTLLPVFFVLLILLAFASGTYNFSTCYLFCWYDILVLSYVGAHKKKSQPYNRCNSGNKNMFDGINSWHPLSEKSSLFFKLHWLLA